jgi:tetratricopeptide (TPR) repeat protein
MDIGNAIKSAFEHFQAGNLQQAENICKEIVKVQPSNINAINLLGIISYQQKDYDSAVHYMNKLVKLAPNNAQAHYMLGHSLQQKGQLDEAIIHYQKSLSLNPDFADAYYNLGTIFQDKKQYDEAISCYQKVLQLNSNDVDAYYNLGFALQEKGRHEEAIPFYRKALQLNPKLDEAYARIGLALQEMDQSDEAIGFYRKANQLDPNNFVALYGLGTTLQQKEEFDEAIICYKKALQIVPNSKAYNNLAHIMQKKQQFDEALTCFQKALELDPSYAQVHMSIGAVLYEKQQFDEALTCFQKALELDPSYAEAYCGLGSTLNEKKQLDESMACYHKALQLNPNSAEAHWNMSLAYLTLGNYRDGWKEYEWRWKVKDHLKYGCFHRPTDFTQPILNRLDAAGHTILIYAEQGLGDEIQFIRYAPLVAQCGAKVVMECHKELFTLFQSVKGVNHIIVQGEPLPGFDIQCPLLTLPLVFNTTLENVISEVPYLGINSSLIRKWGGKIQNNKSAFNIGIAWAGSPTYKGNTLRSCRLNTFSPLARFKDITFYSLQKGEASGQAKNPPHDLNFIDLTEGINDFSDTAALIENLDLVISVDTAVAHLAGALGRPVWTLLPFAADWRWMLDREDSPWYPTMRLFRQSSPRDWESVIEKVRDELVKLLDNN